MLFDLFHKLLIPLLRLPSDDRLSLWLVSVRLMIGHILPRLARKSSVLLEVHVFDRPEALDGVEHALFLFPHSHYFLLFESVDEVPSGFDQV